MLKPPKVAKKWSKRVEKRRNVSKRLKPGKKVPKCNKIHTLIKMLKPPKVPK